MDQKTFKITLLVFIASVCFTTTIIAQNAVPSNWKSYPITESRKMPFQSGKNKNNIPKNIQGLQRPSIVLDSCTTTLYKLILGAPGSSESVKDVTVLQNDQVLVAGNVELTANNRDGLIAKLSNSGTVLWYRHYGVSGYNEWLNKIKQTSDGGSIAIGTSENTTTLERKILILKISTDGLVEWSNTITAAQNSSWTEGIDIIETTGKNYAFTGDNKFSVIYGELAGSGSITWNKSIKLGNEQYALNIIEDYNGWFIGTTGKDSGYSVTNVFKVNAANGNLIWNDKLGGPSQLRHFIAHGMEMANLRPRINGIYRDNNSTAWHLFRGTVNTLSDIESIETYTLGTPIDSTGFSALTPWAEEIGFTGNAASSDIYLFKDVVDAPIRWRYHYDDVHPKKLSALERTLDGGFLIVGNQKETNTAATDIFIYKVDSAGLIPSCPGTAFSATSVINSMEQPYANAFSENVTNNLSQLTVSINSAPLITDTVYTCKEIYCPPVIPADTCLQTFNKAYRSSSFCDLVYDLSEAKDRSLLAAGLMRDNPTDPTTERGTLVKFDKSGNILIKKKAASYGTYYSDIYQMKDSNYLVPSFQNGKLLLTKIDLQLNEIWSTSYQLDNLRFGYNSVVQTSDSSIYITLEYNHPYPAFLMLLKFTKNGTLVWQKNYAANNDFVGFAYGKMIVMNDNIYFCTKTGDGDTYPAQVIIRFDKNNGNITWMKNLSSKDYIFYSNDVFVANGNKLIIGGNISSSPAGTLSKAILAQLDENGTVEKTKVFSSPLSMEWFNSIIIKNGGDIVLGSTETDVSTNPYTLYECLINLDADLNIKSSIKYLVPPSASPGNLITETFDRSILEIGWNYYTEVYNNDFYIRRYAPDGKLGTCPDQPLVLKDSLFTLHPTSLTMATSPDIVITAANESFQAISYDLNLNNTRCGSLTNCSAVKVVGNQDICNIRDTVSFDAARNAGCSSPVFFSFDTSFGKIVSQTDSSIKIKFKKAGKLFLTAEISAGCEIRKDSLQLTINGAHDSLNLGPDLQLCGNTTYTLNAASGYKNYHWNDNSTDSVLIVSSPGLYYVTVADLCGKTFSDSVKVSLAPPVPLSAGADTFKCNTDSIRLVATPGFTKYSWSPGLQITDTTSQTVMVYPTTTTTWYLTAERNPGCFSKDTITITVYSTPPVFLGADTSICISNSVILDGGSSFTRWQWNDGDTSRLLPVQQQGTYSVKAYDKNGCFSTDTLKILNVFANPVVNLNKDSLLCQGSARVLDAGAGFTSYLWNDGSSSRSLEIHDLGKYWVTVSNNNCTGSDTTEIKTIASLPANFAPKDTAICTYESVFLESLFSFNTYLWSTAGNTKAIEVRTPGTYWLQVTDSNNCVAKEFVQVMAKNCPEAIYFPNAFTPNNNNTNDSYRPKIFGTPSNYRFTIFNRYGEKVFETSDSGKSWDGKVKSINQNQGTFVWICTFQFSNGFLRTEKGSFVLIR